MLTKGGRCGAGRARRAKPSAILEDGKENGRKSYAEALKLLEPYPYNSDKIVTLTNFCKYTAEVLDDPKWSVEIAEKAIEEALSQNDLKDNAKGSIEELKKDIEYWKVAPPKRIEEDL